jgi:hypothetical protein
VTAGLMKVFSMAGALPVGNVEEPRLLGKAETKARRKATRRLKR